MQKLCILTLTKKFNTPQQFISFIASSINKKITFIERTVVEVHYYDLENDSDRLLFAIGNNELHIRYRYLVYPLRINFNMESFDEIEKFLKILAETLCCKNCKDYKIYYFN